MSRTRFFRGVVAMSFWERAAWATAIMTLACGLAIRAASGEADSPTSSDPEQLQEPALQEPAQREVFQASDPVAETKEETEVAVSNPYAGHKSWCEPLFYERQCKVDSDCQDIEHVAQRPLRCVRPAWARRDNLKGDDGEPLRVCAPGYATKTERLWRKARLREIVRVQYTDELEHCPNWVWRYEKRRGHIEPVYEFDNGKGLAGQNWRCQREWRLGEQLADFLWVPYLRETTARPWKRHQLPADQRANEEAWVNKRRSYGWEMDFVCETNNRPVKQRDDGFWYDDKGRKCRRSHLIVTNAYPDPEAEHHNPYYGERHRWGFGLGPVGKNTAYGVQDWDIMAPPEVLCREVEGFESYLRDVRGAVQVFRGQGVECGDGRYRGQAMRGEDLVDEPSWLDVHRVASAGKFCPRNDEQRKSKTSHRLESVGLSPFAPVTLDMLGHPIPRESQNERAIAILDQVDAALPPPWTELGRR